MARGFGDVLRGLGSVLNPAVAQELGAEDRQQAQAAQQIGMAGLQQRFQQAAEQRAQTRLEQSPEYQAKLEALKNEKAFREEVGAAGGDMTRIAGAAVKYGKPELAVNIYNQTEARAARIQQAKVEAERHVRELELRLADKALDRESRERLSAQADETKRMLGGFQAELARSNQQLRGVQIQMITDQRQRAEAEKEERTIEGQIGKTADRMKDVTPVFTAAKQLNKILGRYTPEEVPGLGYAKNTDIGKVFLSDEGKDVSSSIKLFGNSVLKAMSGAAVTAPEEIRQMAAQMADGRFSAKDFYIAWPKMSKWVNDQVSLSTAGLTPKAKERFIERTGLDLSPITPRFNFEDGKLKDGKGVPPPPPGFKVN
jgi:hypothetical protein